MDQPRTPAFPQVHGAQRTRAPHTDLQSPTVLIADASALFRRNLGNILQQEGYRILYAETGAEAVSLCAKERPDLVLLEIEIPGINGIAACQAMKERLGIDDLYVFLTTSQEREDMLRATRAIGADQVLQKPVEIEPMVETIRSLLMPLPTSQQPLTITSLDTRRSCHVSGWRHRSRGLTLDHGPEFDWLGPNLQTGIKVHVSYLAEDGAGIVRAATLRQVWKNLNQKVLEVAFGSELQRVRSREVMHQTVPLQVKYASPAGDYVSGTIVNVSGGGMRLADLRDTLEIGTTVPLFLIRESDVLFSLNGEVKGGRLQPDGRFEGSFALIGMSADSERRLAQTLFGS